MGIGHELRGDDAVGSEIIQRLQAFRLENTQVLCVHAGHAPENILGRICQFEPDVVLFIDAVSMNMSPGTIRLIEIDEISGEAFSTHALSIKLIANYLKQGLNCDLLILGIQPIQCELGAGMSSSVQLSLESIVDYLSSEFRKVNVYT